MLNGNILLKVLIGEYVVIAIAFAVNRDWIRMSYWLGATVLNTSLLYMK